MISLRDRLGKAFGITKPNALEWGAWKKWEKETKAAYPIGYFLTETLNDWFWDTWYFIRTPYKKAGDFFYYRRKRFDRIETGLDPTKFWGTDERMLHGIFNMLVEYVEVERAFSMCFYDEEAAKKYSFSKWRRFRSPAAGLAYLEWEQSLVIGENETSDPERVGMRTDQAFNADAIAGLYVWWTKIRPARPDPYVESGYDDYVAKHGSFSGSLDSGEEPEPEMPDDRAAILDKIEVIENRNYDEDTRNVTRLIKIRNTIWS